MMPVMQYGPEQVAAAVSCVTSCFISTGWLEACHAISWQSVGNQLQCCSAVVLHMHACRSRRLCMATLVVASWGE